jgi:molecular chaperone DnaJ
MLQRSFITLRSQPPPLLGNRLGSSSGGSTLPSSRAPVRALCSSVKEDYYATLGVAKDASKSDIKKSYYTKAKQHHPDTNAGDPAAAKKFAELTEAYEVLSDAEKRQVYDQYGHAGMEGGGGGGMGGMGGFGGFAGGRPMSPEDIFSVFEEAFGGGAFNLGGRQRRPRRGRDVQVGVTLDLLEAAKGCRKTVSWRSPATGNRSMEVTIPSGVDSGMNLRLTGEGEAGPAGGAGPGNLYISITVAEHTIFERDGNDLHVKVRLSLAEAILGGKVTIPTLDGDVALKVPAGTQAGDRRVMTGRGVQPAGGRGAGHQYVHFDVVVPRKLSDRQRELIEEFREEEEPMGDEERTRRQ